MQGPAPSVGGVVPGGRARANKKLIYGKGGRRGGFCVWCMGLMLQAARYSWTCCACTMSSPRVLLLSLLLEHVAAAKHVFYARPVR